MNAHSSLAVLLVVAVGGCGKSCDSGSKAAGRAPSAAPLAVQLKQAVEAKGDGYRPRTRHLLPGGAPKYTNRLVLETSPYLLQHAHNPVNWYPWGDEAFETAKREGKPVLLSVGYSTCHWCHVMERESFEDEEIARFLNENYVAIKVDREERPDVDALYMNAVHLLSGRGGWPMTVVLTADRQPFFAGSYFPARDGDRGASKGFLTILKQLRTLHTTKPEKVVALGQRVTSNLQAAATPAVPQALPGPRVIHDAALALAAAFDPVNGGFGGAPKFPTPSTLELMARVHRRTKDPQALRILDLTLDRMAAGGIADQVGGGFHRYSTDERWLVPHFEKMLYDNAQLVSLYLEGFQLTGRQDFARVAQRTLEYVAREMTDPGGGFYSATDADSPVPNKPEEEEGYFFTWPRAELLAALGPERGREFEVVYGVSEAGNFEGRNILFLPRPVAKSAEALGVPLLELEARLEASRKTLLELRNRRPAPLRDEKIIAAWNGLMISAFARGSSILGEPRWAVRARSAANFVLQKMRSGRKLTRTFKDGQARNEGMLEDYAFLIQGLIDLFEATQETRWLTEAIALQATLDEHFADAANGGYFQTPSAHGGLLTRDKPDYDGAEPSGNSVAAMNLLRLSELTGEERYREQAQRAFGAFGAALRNGGGAAGLLCALDYFYDAPLEVVLVGPAGATDGGGTRVGELTSVFHRAFVPNRILVVATEGDELERRTKLLPLVEGKLALRGEATAYVCRRKTCELPTSDPRVFATQLALTEPLLPDTSPPPLPVR